MERLGTVKLSPILRSSIASFALVFSTSLSLLTRCRTLDVMTPLEDIAAVPIFRCLEGGLLSEKLHDAVNVAIRVRGLEEVIEMCRLFIIAVLSNLIGDVRHAFDSAIGLQPDPARRKYPLLASAAILSLSTNEHSEFQGWRCGLRL